MYLGTKTNIDKNGQVTQQVGTPRFRYGHTLTQDDLTQHIVLETDLYTMLRVGSVHKVVLSSRHTCVQVSGSAGYCRDWLSNNV